MRPHSFVALGLVFVATAYSADQKTGQDAKASASVQQQIDELKRTQVQILQELEAIKALLQQSPPRVEMPAQPAPPAVLNVHGEPFKGEKDAMVAIIEYSDFDCSHCAQYATKIFPEIDRKYIATGKLKYFFRDLPEKGNPESFLKARVARCAGEQGKFWEMHDHLFAERPSLAGDKLKGEVEAIGLDAAKVAACLAEGKYTINIQRSAVGAVRMGFRGTPTFVIGQVTDNGDNVKVRQVLLGAESIEAIQAVLDELLTPTPKK